MIRRVRERDITVILNKEVRPDDIAKFGADAVILAIGSSPVVPPIIGIEHAIQALDAYKDISKVGKRVLIVGGGLVGCETGINLAREGREVTIIEMCDKAAPDAYPMHRIGLLHEMEQLVTLKTNTRCTGITPYGASAVNGSGNEVTFEADTVIYALGMKAKSTETRTLHEALKDAEVYEVGDCVKAAKVYEAVRQAFTAAMSIY